MKINHSQQDNTEDNGNTSPSLPPHKKRQPSEDGYDGDSLVPADVIVSEESEVKEW